MTLFPNPVNALGKELFKLYCFENNGKSAHSTEVKQNILVPYLIEPQMCTNTEGTTVLYFIDTHKNNY